MVVEDAPGLHIDNNDGHWDFRWNSGKRADIGVGIWIICAGAMLLAANYLEQHVSIWNALWITGLTVFGIFGLWPRFSVFRLGCALAGVYFIADELWPWQVNLEKGYILPIGLLFFGLCLLFDAGKKGKKPAFSINSHINGKHRQHYAVNGERFDCDVSFCEQSYLVDLPRLQGGTADVSFGELTLDLRGCGSFAEGCTLNLNCSFGELTVILPASVRAEASSSTPFGEFSVTGKPSADAAALLLVNADASFGEITLRYI